MKTKFTFIITKLTTLVLVLSAATQVPALAQGSAGTLGSTATQGSAGTLSSAETLGSTATLSFAATQGSAETFVCPAPLQKDDLIAMICPSSCPPDSASVIRAKAELEAWGYRVEIAEHMFDFHHGCAGTPAQRLAMIEKYLRDPEVKCIFCYRGGKGSIRAMMDLPLELIRENPKWLVGYSDVTTMLSAWNAVGVMSLHGDMGCDLSRPDKGGESAQMLRKMLAGELPVYDFKSGGEGIPANRPGHAEGRLFGGNVETMIPSLASAMDPMSGDEDFILFLEDVSAGDVSIERVLCLLKVHGLLEHVKGVICGYFSDYKPAWYENIESLVDDFFADYGIPVVYRFPTGHERPNYPLLMGSKVVLDATGDSVHLEFVK